MTSSYHYSLKNKRVWVAGEHGMVGSALLRRLASEECEILHIPRRGIDFRDQHTTREWIKANRPQVIFLAAAKVGGIAANVSSPADFLYDNLMIAANIIHAAKDIRAERLVFLGSTCIYPKMAPQPITEQALLTGPLEETNEWYAIAKIAGLKLTQAYRRQHGCDFITCQPTNLYGPGDNYNPDTSHVLPALLRRAHEAKANKTPHLVVWGSGRPLREFLHVDDLADAVVFLSQNYSGTTAINVGSGEEVSISSLAKMICDTVGYEGELIFDISRPDGTPRKLADTSQLNALGWTSARRLNEGLRQTYASWLQQTQAALPS